MNSLSDAAEREKLLRSREQVKSESEVLALDDESPSWLKEGFLSRARESFESMWDTEPPPMDWLIENFIPAEGTVGVLAAASTVGKSFLLLILSILAASRDSVFGFDVPKPFPTVFFSGEDKSKDIHRRVKAIKECYAMNGNAAPIGFYPVTSFGDKQQKITEASLGSLITHYSYLDLIIREIESLESSRGLFVFDTLSRFHGGQETNDHLSEFVAACEYLSGNTGWTTLITQHASQESILNGTSLEMTGTRGGMALVNNTRFHIGMQTLTEKECDTKYRGIKKENRYRYVQVSAPQFNHGEKLNNFWLCRAPRGVLVPFDMRVHETADRVSEAPETHGLIKRIIVDEWRCGRYYTKTGFKERFSSEGSLPSHNNIVTAINQMMANGEILEVINPNGNRGKALFVEE